MFTAIYVNLLHVHKIYKQLKERYGLVILMKNKSSSTIDYIKHDRSGKHERDHTVLAMLNGET